MALYDELAVTADSIRVNLYLIIDNDLKTKHAIIDGEYTLKSVDNQKAERIFLHCLAAEKLGLVTNALALFQLCINVVKKGYIKDFFAAHVIVHKVLKQDFFTNNEERLWLEQDCPVEKMRVAKDSIFVQL